MIELIQDQTIYEPVLSQLVPNLVQLLVIMAPSLAGAILAAVVLTLGQLALAGLQEGRLRDALDLGLAGLCMYLYCFSIVSLAGQLVLGRFDLLWTAGASLICCVLCIIGVSLASLWLIIWENPGRWRI